MEHLDMVGEAGQKPIDKGSMVREGWEAVSPLDAKPL